jgi:penicillin-insensitive murein DD-endopeptidase
VPAWYGAIGTGSSGVLAGGTELARDGGALNWLRSNDRHWALPRFANAIARAARTVARERPGALLYVGDLSGIDADLLFYVTTLEGAPVDSPGFVHFGPDGIARDEAHERWVRFDVEREWLLIKALIEDPEARIQWIFISDVVHATLVEWATARGDSIETIRRAQQVMLEPHPGGVHDDHIHVRTACSPEEIVRGCEPSGPRRAWLDYELSPPEETSEEFAIELAQPLEPSALSKAAGEAPGQATTASQAKSVP